MSSRLALFFDRHTRSSGGTGMPDPHTGYNPGYNPPFPGAPLGPPPPMPPGSADTFPIPISAIVSRTLLLLCSALTGLTTVHLPQGNLLPTTRHILLHVMVVSSAIVHLVLPLAHHPQGNHCQLSDIVLVHVGFLFSYHHPSGPPPGPPPPG